MEPSFVLKEPQCLRLPLPLPLLLLLPLLQSLHQYHHHLEAALNNGNVKASV